MRARLRTFLTPEEDRTLFELRTATTVAQRIKDSLRHSPGCSIRASDAVTEALRLSAHGWYVEKIAAYLNWTPQTVRETIHRWNTRGLGGLWEAPGRGAKPRWQSDDIAYLEACLEQEPRTYNSRQLAQKLESDRQIHLSPDRIRRLLKKRG